MCEYNQEWLNGEWVFRNDEGYMDAWRADRYGRQVDAILDVVYDKLNEAQDKQTEICADIVETVFASHAMPYRFTARAEGHSIGMIASGVLHVEKRLEMESQIQRWSGKLATITGKDGMIGVLLE